MPGRGWWAWMPALRWKWVLPNRKLSLPSTVSTVFTCNSRTELRSAHPDTRHCWCGYMAKIFSNCCGGNFWITTGKDRGIAMLRELYIEDFALIHRLTVGLGDGLNILTGETGAGKSIIIDALNQILEKKTN